MNKGDLLVERGAARLQQLAQRAAGRGDGIGKLLSVELREDAEFLRKLKPSLIKARARGKNPPARGPSEPLRTPERKPGKGRNGGGPSPLVVVGAALVAGIVIAKVIDWRGHAHPRD